MELRIPHYARSISGSGLSRWLACSRLLVEEWLANRRLTMTRLESVITGFSGTTYPAAFQAQKLEFQPRTVLEHTFTIHSRPTPLSVYPTYPILPFVALFRNFVRTTWFYVRTIRKYAKTLHSHRVWWSLSARKSRDSSQVISADVLDHHGSCFKLMRTKFHLASCTAVLDSFNIIRSCREWRYIDRQFNEITCTLPSL